MELKSISKISLGKWEVVSKGEKIAIIATGKMVQKAMIVKAKYNLDVMIINAIFIKPLDNEILSWLIKSNYDIITIEDNVLNGGFNSLIHQYLNQNKFRRRIISMGFNDKFIEQGNIEELFKQECLSIEDIKNNIDILSN